MSRSPSLRVSAACGAALLVWSCVATAQPSDRDVQLKRAAEESAVRSADNKSSLDAALKKAPGGLSAEDLKALDEAARISKNPPKQLMPSGPMGGTRMDIDPAKIAKQYEQLMKPGDEEGDGSETPKEVIVFASLSMPRTSLERLAKEAASVGVSLQFRGLSKGIGPNFLKSVAELDFIRQAGGGADLNPDLFKQYDIRRVPAFVVSSNPKSGCAVDACSSEAAVVYGDVSMLFAMNVIAKRADAVGDIARRTVRDLEQRSSKAATARPSRGESR